MPGRRKPAQSRRLNHRPHFAVEVIVIIHAPTMYDCWEELNRQFLEVDPNKHGMLIPSRDFSRMLWPVRLHASAGFGVDRPLPPFFASYEKRVRLLATRYIDPDLWQEGIDRITARRKRMQLRNPLSFSVQFHRRPTKERKVPAGGGCLQVITFMWCNGRWGIMIYLRASEITARLLADIVFVNWAVEKIMEEANPRKWGEAPLEIIWDIGLASQMKYMVPVFLLHTEGEESVFHRMFVDPTANAGNEWHLTVAKHFWHTFIEPEHINWAQRRKWSEKFVEATELDWQIAREKWMQRFGVTDEDLSHFP